MITFLLVTFIAVGTALQSVQMKSWNRAIVDYRAANEYFVEAYGRPYFESDDGERDVPVFNAREGFLMKYDEERAPRIVSPTLSTCGFTIIEGSPDDRPDDLTDWTDRKQIGKLYLPTVRKILSQVYDHEIEQIVFWNPTLRNKTSLFVAPAHIDTDINAYPDARSLMDLIYDRHIPEAASTYTKEDWIQALESGQRFSYVNIWRNLDKTPVQQAPLGLLVPYYDRNDARMPIAHPVDADCRWYCYPELTQDEYLLFCQYDRDARKLSDIWHGALTRLLHDVPDNQEKEEKIVPRCSFDLRCFILFKDSIVPTEFDRFHPDNKVVNRLSTE